MHPELHLNYAAVAAAVIASFAFGALWYGPLFGKKWAELMGLKMENAKPAAWMFLLTLLGVFLTAYVIAHDVLIWRPSVWGLGEDQPDYMYGFFAGFFVWLGFYLPMLFGSVTWEGKPWKLFCLNATYHFLNLQIIAMILANWR